MNKARQRPNREAIKRQRKEKKRAERGLRQRQKAQGLERRIRVSASNRRSGYQTVQEEQQSRQDAVVEQLRVFRAKLPILLERLSRIKDSRNPKKTKYKLTVLMIYGILSFVFQMASRREANREMTRPMFLENLQLLFPDIESIPHHDTLYRLLAKIDVNEIEAAQIELVRRLIRKKKFSRYLLNGYYPIAIDGTQKFKSDYLWDEEFLQREVKDGKETKEQYFVYVVEANLAFANGMSIPLMSEFLSYTQGDMGQSRQDCEVKGFKRLAKRLKAEFGRLPILVLLDGLYPNGPIMELCCKNHWDFMIVLQDKSLPSVWEEYEGLKKLESENVLHRTWGDRKQRFEWVNHIEYYYGPNDRKKQIVHMVICQENWQEVGKDRVEIITKQSRHVWISSKPLTRWNVHERCNLGARHRWAIESGILVEKRHGYYYEHLFSYDWNAMKGYHYLMRLGHLINVLAQYSERLVKLVRELGMGGFIRFVRETISGPWLDEASVKKRLARPFQLRLI